MTQFLPYLLFLLCPLTMGAMMWVMMRGMDSSKKPDPRVAELESQVNDLRSAIREPAAKAEDARPVAHSASADRTA